VNLKKLEKYLRVNLFGPGPRLLKKRIYRAAVWQRLRNTKCQPDIFAIVTNLLNYFQCVPLCRPACLSLSAVYGERSKIGKWISRASERLCRCAPREVSSRHFLSTNGVPVGLMSSAFLPLLFFFLFNLQLNFLSTKFIEITFKSVFLIPPKTHWLIPHLKRTTMRTDGVGNVLRHLEVQYWDAYIYRYKYGLAKSKCIGALDWIVKYIYIWPCKEKVHWRPRLNSEIYIWPCKEKVHWRPRLSSEIYIYIYIYIYGLQRENALAP